MNHPLQWKKYPVLNDGFICLVDVMGDDYAIVQAARVSYGKDERELKNVKEAVEKIINSGIPVMGHLGLMPQSIYKYGTYSVRAREEEEADKLIADAQVLQEAGCFALVLEKIPASLAEKVSKALHIPVIGIGAGGGCDGQVLVSHDLLGITKDFHPRFLRRYLNLYDTVKTAVGQYVGDVKSGDFPNENEQY